MTATQPETAKQKLDAFLGIDIGSISTKGVIIDCQRQIIARSYQWTEGDPVNASRRVIAEDSKLICVDGGIAVDYAMNTLCAAGTGAFLSSQAHRLGVEVEQFGEIALTSKKPANIAARCTVFAESDLVHKIQVGYAREDIIAGLCKSVAVNYLNNVGKGKNIIAPVVFQGGVSKNIGVVRAFRGRVGYSHHR